MLIPRLGKLEMFRSAVPTGMVDLTPPFLETSTTGDDQLGMLVSGVWG